MAGIRISSVTAVGLMTIAAYIEADVLGTLVISGIQMDNTSMILANAIPTCMLALGIDFFMSKVEKSITPTSLQLSTNNLTPEKIASYKRNKKATMATITALFIVITTVFIRTSMTTQADIIVGSKEAVERGQDPRGIANDFLRRDSKVVLVCDSKIPLCVGFTHTLHD